ncbi:hypothetical protein BGX31_007660 [Mortierella sp. GBA43]|nr:hypothetical protein BGX31_007660 [Mortierella sp. GBA43]
MGVFLPLCVVQGGKFLYAFTRTRTYNKERAPTAVYMLVKSNENPSHTLEDLTWTPVSVISTDGYPEVQAASGSFLRFNCAFDVDTGVFTMFHLSFDATMVYSSAGLQYVPQGTSGGNAQPPANAFLGTGTWKKVTFPPDYKWPESGSSRMFNYKDTQNNKTHLMHVYNNSSDVYVSTLDPVTMTVNQGPSWTSTMSGFYPKAFSANSQNLYMMADNYTLTDTTALYQFPINGANRQDSSSTISLLNGTDLITVGEVIGGIDDFTVSVLVIMDIPPVPYMIYQDTKRNFYSVPLSGSLAGIKVAAKKNMTVAENYGDYPPSSINNGSDGGLSDWGSGLGKDGSKSSTGAIVGGVCAVVVVVIAVLGFLYYRRRRQLNNHQGIDKPKTNSPPDSSLPSAAILVEPHLTQSWNQAPIQQVQPPPQQNLQVYDRDQVQQQQTPVTSSTLTYSGSLPGYSRHPPASASTPPVPVHTRPLTTQHGFP